MKILTIYKHIELKAIDELRMLSREIDVVMNKQHPEDRSQRTRKLIEKGLQHQFDLYLKHRKKFYEDMTLRFNCIEEQMCSLCNEEIIRVEMSKLDSELE